MVMCNLTLALISFLHFFIQIKSFEKHGKEKYFKNNHFIETITQSLKRFKDCDPQDCFLMQRRTDFRYWVTNSGIKESDIRYALDNRLGEHYQIINRTLYRQKNCIFPSRCSGNEYFIKNILKLLPDGDIEFVVNSHDWPKSRKRTNPAPVFSFSKTSNELDILYPAWSFWEGGPALTIYPKGIGRWDLQKEKLEKASETWLWHMKKSIAFFRGSRTSDERDPLILLSRRKPDVVDAKYTKNQAWRSKQDTLGDEPAEEVPFEEHCRYKYLFNFKGVAASFRFKHLFLCKSLVFHVGDEWNEFFYGEMKPWVHYVPVSTSLEETEDLLNFFNNNDEIAKDIAERGYQFVKSKLTLNSIKKYWTSILKRYMKLSKWETKFNTSLVRVS